MRGIPARIGRGIGKLDLFSTRGAEPQQQKGMRALWLDNVLAAISGAFLFTYVPLYALALGATNTQIGTLSSAASLMGMLAPIPGAQLAERWGSRKRAVVTVWGAGAATAGTLSSRAAGGCWQGFCLHGCCVPFRGSGQQPRECYGFTLTGSSLYQYTVLTPSSSLSTT